MANACDSGFFNQNIISPYPVYSAVNFAPALDDNVSMPNDGVYGGQFAPLGHDYQVDQIHQEFFDPEYPTYTGYVEADMFGNREPSDIGSVSQLGAHEAAASTIESKSAEESKSGRKGGHEVVETQEGKAHRKNVKALILKTTGPGKEYGCAECGKRFTRSTGAEEHIWSTHFQDRVKARFVCITSGCSSTFMLRRSTFKHQRYMGDINYYCECGRGFARNDNMHAHRARKGCKLKA